MISLPVLVEPNVTNLCSAIDRASKTDCISSTELCQHLKPECVFSCLIFKSFNPFTYKIITREFFSLVTEQSSLLRAQQLGSRLPFFDRQFQWKYLQKMFFLPAKAARFVPDPSKHRLPILRETRHPSL